MSPTVTDSQDAGSFGTYQPTIVDLSLGVPRAWPTGGALALCVAAFVAQVALTDAYYSLTTAICGGLEAAIVLLLATRYVKVRPHRLPWIEMAAAHHYAQFGVALLSGPTTVGMVPIVPHSDSFEFGSFVALFSGFATIAGFLVARRAARRLDGAFPLPKLEPDILARGGRIHLVIAVSYVFLDLALPSSRILLLPITNILQTFFGHTPLLVVAMATYLVTPRPVYLVQALGAFAILAMLVARSSMLIEILGPSLVVLPLWWRARERLPIVLIAVPVAIAIVLQPVKGYYRNIRWDEHQANQEIGVVDAWSQAFSESSAASHSARAESQTGTEATANRMSELACLAYTVEVVPDSIPHTGGIVYPMLLTSLIPRVFWPEKPNMNRYALNPFVIALGLTTPEASEHSAVGISLAAQGYLEHGVAGSIGWMMLFGLMLGLVSRYFGTTLAGVVAGATVLGLSASAGGGFQSTFGSAGQAILGATLLVWLLWLAGGGYRSEVNSSPGIRRGGEFSGV